MKPTVYAPFLAMAALAACSNSSSPNAGPTHTTYSAQGDSATIGAKLDEFRTALGGSLNAPNSAPAASGRREINWDGVPAAVTNVDDFPATFFNVNSKRGAVFSTPGTGLRIDSTAFASVSAGLAAQFKAFSPKKLFVPVGSTHLEVDFKVVGLTTNGLVNGFGVVFSDVDRAGSAKVDFFDAAAPGSPASTAPATAAPSEFSFVGAVFDSRPGGQGADHQRRRGLTDQRRRRQRGGATDLVVMDDFVYGEPQPVQ